MPPPRQRDRHAALSFGRRAEWIAALYLMAKGYRILARGYRVNGGELDIVARRGRAIAFVEVKARPQLESAMIAITPAKIARMSRAAAVWLAANPWAAGHVLRADAIYLAPWRAPRHAVAAVELQLG